MAHVAAADIPAIYHFHGVGSHLESDEVFCAQVKAGAKKLEAKDGAIVLTGSGLTLPADLDPMTATVVLPAPGEEEYRSLLGNLIRDLSHRQYVEVDYPRRRRPPSETPIRADPDGSGEGPDQGHRRGPLPYPRRHPHVIEAKKAVVERDGLLEYYPVEQTMANVADLLSLKAWLAKRKNVVANPPKRRIRAAFPSGVLLLGVPGCGKSLWPRPSPRSGASPS